MSVRRGLIALLAALPLGAPAVGGDLGPPVRGSFAIAGKTIPLPAGDWRLVARRHTPAGETPTGVALRSAALVQLSGDRVVAAVTIHTNETPLAHGLPIPDDRTRNDILLTATVYKTRSDGACAWINHVVEGTPPAGIDPLWRDAMAALGPGLPALWLEAGFWIGDRQDVLDIRYHFVPPGDDGSRPTRWSDSPWSPANIGEGNARSVAIEDLALWIRRMVPLVELGLHDRLARYQPAAMPWTRQAVDMPPDKAMRLRQLDALFAAGGIDAATHEAQRSTLEEAPVAELTDPNIFLRAVYKTMTFKLVGMLDGFFIAWAMLGGPATSAAITAIGTVAYSAVYYMHDVAWSMFDASTEKTASWTVLPIGIDRQL
jgi:uncharacterized membrane protein